MSFKKGNQYGKLNKGKKLSEKTKRQIGIASKQAHKIKSFGFQKGHGRFRTDESYYRAGKKISQTFRKRGVGFQKGCIPWDKGKKYSKKRVEKMRKQTKEEYQMGKRKPYWLGKKRSEKMKDKIRGNNHPNWKGGATRIEKLLRKSTKFKEWRKAVFERDDYTCWICGYKGKGLHPHHLKSFSDYPKLRFEISNGVTLCEFCHKTYTEFGGRRK